MLDYFWNLRKSPAEKRAEQVTAYVDNALSARERQQFEQEMAADPDLQAEVAQLQAFKLALRRIPQRRVPRNFTLDPATVGRPEPAGLTPFYPALRAATALTAFFFIFAIALSVVTGGQMEMTADSAAPIAREMEAETAVEALEEAESFAAESAPADEDMAAEAVPAEEMPAGEAADAADNGAEATMMVEAEEPPAAAEAPQAEMMVETEVVEEDMAEEEAAESAGDALTEEAMTEESLDTEAAPLPAATPTPALTATPSPTPQPATLPPPPERAPEDGAAIVEEAAPEAAVMPTAEPPISQTGVGIEPLLLVQLGLGALLVILALLTLYTRRQL